MNLGTYLSRSAMYWPDEVAVACADRKWTFAGLESEANRLAAALIGRGLRPGDAVASLAWNRGELVVVEFALYKAGLLRVPVNARLGRGEVEHVLENSAARVVFVDADHVDLGGDAAGRCQVVVLGVDAAPVPGALAYAELCAEAGTEAPVAVEVGEDDPCVLNYTSGSTGALKAATQTFGNRLANMRKQHMSDDSRPRPGTRYLACGPITHAGGMNLLAGALGGAASHVLPHWGVEAFLDTLERERITDTFVVPAMLAMLLDHPDTRKRDLSSLVSLRVGGAPISPARLRQAVEVFGPIVSQGYGLGETTSVVAGLSSEVIANAVKDDPELLASCGRAAFDSEIRVVGEDGADLPPRRVGEIIVRGPDCVPGYWGEPELSAEAFRDGWVYTGDLAWMREDGYLFIVDRRKDMIISGGFNIYSMEVEAVLAEHPAVRDVCVVGVPDEKWGEAVAAIVVRRADVTAEELVGYCAERLDRYKKPKTVEFVDSLPVNRNGKVDRKAVRAPYWAGAERKVG
jgi:acyl-CoA synthetase (AMP-forming)/AMP-acid ligase II